MSLIAAPADVADLHPTCDGWTRSFPWQRSTRRRDHYEATFFKRCLSEATSDGEASLKPVRVYINRNIIKNAAAAWEIARQLKAARVPRRRQRVRSRIKGNEK